MTYQPLDALGVPQVATEAEIEDMTEAQRETYGAVHLAFAELAKRERAIEVATKDVELLVARQRKLEAALAALPKITPTQALRKVIAAQAVTASERRRG